MNIKAATESIFKGRKGLFILYILGLCAILPYTFWYVNNPDTFQYISIAKKLAAGHFSLALNAYWSPLVSWLITLPVLMGFDGIVSFKLIQILIGFFAIDAWFRLCQVLPIKVWYHNVLGFAIIPFVLDYAILNPTADLLFLMLNLYFISLMLKFYWVQGTKQAAQIGLLGAVLYFAKAFGFPLFISVLFLSGIFCERKKEKHGIVKLIMISMLVFIAISSLWFVPLSIKQGHLTISEAAHFNLSKEVAPLPGMIMNLPVLSGPMLAPPDEYALSAWESPGETLTLHRLDPFSSSSDFKYYLQVVKRNLLSIWYFDFRNQLGFVFLCLIGLFILKVRNKKAAVNRSILFLFFVMLIFYGGYSLILVHTRYLWICTWIMLILSAWLWERITKNSKSNPYYFYFGFCIVLFLAVKRPVKEILFSRDVEVPMLWIGKGISQPLATMEIIYRPEENLRKIVEDLKKDYPEFKGRIASLQSKDIERHLYSSSLFIVEQSEGQYYGPLSNELSINEMKEVLSHFGISYLLVWNHTEWKCRDQNWVKSMYFDANSGFIIYDLF